MGSPADSGIGATGAAMENQMNGADTTAGEQIRSDPLMGPGQITATTGRDHQGSSRGNYRPRWIT
jgi:hypothetical protein